MYADRRGMSFINTITCLPILHWIYSTNEKVFMLCKHLIFKALTLVKTICLNLIKLKKNFDCLCQMMAIS